jgi:hypothetical protein
MFKEKSLLLLSSGELVKENWSINAPNIKPYFIQLPPPPPFYVPPQFLTYS